MKTTTVIVSACKGEPGNYSSYGECERIDYFNTDHAMRTGEGKKGQGMSVIVRPNYNESDSEGRFFREWRSFDGEPFKECRWRIGPCAESPCDSHV